MSGRVGLREDTRIGHSLAQRIAQLFVEARRPLAPVMKERRPC